MRNEKLLTALAELTVVMGVAPLTPQRQLLFLRALDDLTTDALLFAFDRASRECEFFPVPAVLRRLSQPYRRPALQDLNTPEISYTPHELAAEKMAELMRAVETGDFSGLQQ